MSLVLSLCMHTGTPFLAGGLALASHWSSVYACTPGRDSCPGRWPGSGFSLVLSLCMHTREGSLSWQLAWLWLFISPQFVHAHQGGTPVLAGGLALASHWSSVCACTPGRDPCPGSWLGSGFLLVLSLCMHTREEPLFLQVAWLWLLRRKVCLILRLLPVLFHS